MGKKKPAGKRMSLDELLSHSGGRPTDKERLEMQKKTHVLMAQTLRDLEEWPNTVEGQARETLRIRLEELRNDEAIKKSEVCLEVLDAFIHCVSYRWGAADSGGMIEPLAEHFNKVKAASGGKARVAASPKQAVKATVRTYWDRWQKGKSLYPSKAGFALDMLRMFGPESDTDEKGALKSSEVLARWCREWEKEGATKPAE